MFKKPKVSSSKKIIFVASYSATDFYSDSSKNDLNCQPQQSQQSNKNSRFTTSTSINFMTEDWTMITIDDLK
jgi:hypothetical protein